MCVCRVCIRVYYLLSREVFYYPDYVVVAFAALMRSLQSLHRLSFGCIQGVLLPLVFMSFLVKQPQPINFSNGSLLGKAVRSKKLN